MLMTISESMSALVTALQSVLNFDNLMSNFTSLVPVIGGVILFAFTYRIVRRMIKGTTQGKARV